jgi:hypothetical protein
MTQDIPVIKFKLSVDGFYMIVINFNKAYS